MTAPTPSEHDYPAEVLRYGEAGKARFDGDIAALVDNGFPESQARTDVLAMWALIAQQAQLQPSS